jgi:hypothetical protein
MDHKFASCADCAEYPDPRACKDFNSFFAKVFGFFMRSDRAACVDQIRRLGVQGHADEMTRARRQTIRR